MTSRAFVFVFVFASNHRPNLEHGWLRKCVSGHFTRIRRLVIAVITLPPPAIGWSPPHILNFILWRFSPFWSHFLSVSPLGSKRLVAFHLLFWILLNALHDRAQPFGFRTIFRSFIIKIRIQSSCTSNHRSHLIIDNQNQDSKARTYPINHTCPFSPTLPPPQNVVDLSK